MSKAAKRRGALDNAQLGFTFDTPTPLTSEGALRDLDRIVAAAVARALKDDRRTRWEVAGKVSALLDDEVSKLMLDAYASEARDGHNISAARFFALVAATDRYDLLETLCRRIGCTILVGEEVVLAEIGHLESIKKATNERLQSLKSIAQPMTRGTTAGGASE